MSTSVRVLMIQHSTDQVASLRRILRENEIDAEVRQVTTPDALRDALRQGTWDLAIAEPDLPGLAWPEIRSILAPETHDIGVLVVAEPEEEEKAIRALADGCDDYLLSDRLRRLPAAVRAVLRAARHRQSEATLKGLLQAAPIGIGTVRDRILGWVNEQMARMIGYEADQLSGRNARLLYPSEEEYDRVGRVKHPQIRQHGAGALETRFLRRDGTSIDVLLSSACIDPEDFDRGLVFTATDISELKRAEAAIRETELAERAFQERLRALHDVSNELIRCESLDELCRRAVELGRERLGFDRLGIWLLSQNSEDARGTFGTDEAGDIRDERGCRRTLTRHWDVLERPSSEAATLEEDAPIHGPDGRVIGRGMHAWAAIWDGTRNIGLLDADNFLTREAITDADCELLGLYATALGHLYARTQAVTESKDNERRLRSIVESLPVILYSVEGGTNRMLLIMGAVREILGRDEDYFFPEAPFSNEHIHVDDREFVAKVFEEGLKRGKPFEVEYRTHYPEGEQTTWIREFVVPTLRPDGSVLRQDGIVLDISEAKQAEMEREQMQAQLLRAQKLESLGVLAGGIAHDFNNLLTVISGNTQFLRLNLPEDSETAGVLDDIDAAATQAAEMTRSLQAFGRPAQPRIRKTNPNQLIENAYRLLRRMIPATIDFKLDLMPDVPAVEVDPGQMQQILVNLCVNARDALPTGGHLCIMSRHAGRAELPVKARLEAVAEEFVRISVSDDGIGMDASTLARVFDPFFTTKPQDQGTGLGLAIVYKIVEAHRGAVEITSRPDDGTRVDVFFPAAPAVVDVETKVPPRTVAKGKERILVVDDENLVASLLKTVLESRGYRVHLAERAEQAFDLMERARGGFELAIIDYALPGTTGDCCLTRLREHSPDLKAILITGYNLDATDLTTDRCRILHKPFAVPALVELVRETLDHA